MQTITAAGARRSALAAQGFAATRPQVPTRSHLRAVLARLQLLQLDSVNVAVRAHYMPLFSRLGCYPRSLLDEAAWAPTRRRPRLFVEYWAHEASLIPPQDWALFRWRMRHYEQRYALDATSVANTGTPGVVDQVLAAVTDLGPVSAGELETALGVRAPKIAGGWWERSEVKRVCEWLFAIGALTTGTRRGFQRLYDLPQRVLAPSVLTSQVDDDVAFRELTTRAATALGVATEPDLRDYYRLPPRASQQAVAELVEAGELEQLTVRGWPAPAYRRVGTPVARKIEARALLCPFDPVVWLRERALRMFDFHYRIEIYTPAHKRVHGYYVFPFLLGDRLVARVDLKADRHAGVLRVNGAFGEPHVDAREISGPLADELRTMAQWLELDCVIVADHGDLARDLRAAL